ncbi:hypothetical protein SH2C18_05940 [Clostridium sediminicola]|uniref:exonuclease n=1 Tax=Clostridium sediminicola TaxID=3114879 RepID=UPI0031F1F713
MSFYIIDKDDMIFIPFDILAIDFEFVSTRIIKNKAKRYLQEIVEIGAILKSDLGEFEYTTIVKPKNFIECREKENKCIYASRFSMDEINNGISLMEAIDNLEEYYTPNETVWISWGIVEYRILKNLCESYRFKVPFLYDDYLDLSEEFRRFYNLSHKVSLDKALNMLHIKSSIRHFALEDSKLLLKILHKMFIEGYRIGEE